MIQGTTMKQAYSGGCHCGAVRYEAQADLSQGTVRCNCSICSKSRAWLVAVDPTDFQLLQGEDALSVYQFGAKQIQHLFCRTCGVKSFARVATPGGQFIAIMVSCLDNVADTDLAQVPIVYVDGRNDDFQSSPAETRHL
jgi:hypothetical protein